MRTKKIFYSEAAYLLGVILLALGTAWMERGDFGLSMVVAPAYILHLKISEFLPFFSFGMAEYALQFVLISALALYMRRLKAAYLFSVATIVFYGALLDLCIWVTSLIPFSDSVAARLLFYVVGMLVVAVGVSLLFHTYLPPASYELVVKELSAYHGFNINKCKTIYDCISCAVAIILSFVFFGFMHFEGVGFGTVVTALINGFLIGQASRLLESRFEFRDRLSLRRCFT